MRFRRSLTVSIAVVALAASFPQVSLAAPPAAWGWTVARHPSMSSYVPAAMDRGNSAGLVNTVERTSVGSYTVVMPGISNGEGGDVQVSALSSSPRYCLVVEWFTGSAGHEADIDVVVTCHRFNGTLIDSAFAVSYMARGYSSGTIGYAWADSPTSTDYTPD